jgi:hypothetical protein
MHNYFVVEYRRHFREFEAEFRMALTRKSGVQDRLFDEQSQKHSKKIE